MARVDDGRSAASASFPSSRDPLFQQYIPVDVHLWLRRETSALLWVQGPASALEMTKIALRVSTIIEDDGTPCVLYFRKQVYRLPPNIKLTAQEAALLSLLYSTVSQLVSLLPGVFRTESSLEEEDFSKLNGSTDSAEPALEMVRRLLTLAPAEALFVIDGIQGCDTTATRRHIEALVDILRDQGSKAVVKVLFITRGESQALASKLTVEERVNY
ncbi:hypothetical protein BR93DRAFT_978822 [Coniochaeta sp. PMI_546]|nr:hypothetical protein BR93DRAFT_978822 [Coniochaeta sp. PMI_546]